MKHCAVIDGSTPIPWGKALDPQPFCFGGAQAPIRVGRFPPNEFAMNGMIGNVWIWQSDRFNEVSGDPDPFQ
ncbi:MAG: SUMF1/EgtB/PvdO family nonheme iron enzyme [Pirellulales bacterium]|nr:SUMF1/EgtB/PvdO family nonheme iron enzyme [Pirellulales bacterium]